MTTTRQATSNKSLSVIRKGISAFFFMQGFIFASWASRIPNVQQILHLDDGSLGTILLALPAGLMVSLPISGWLVTRFGSRQSAIFSMVLYAFTLPIIGLADEVWQLVAVLFLFGLIGNLVNISVNTQAVGIEALYKRSILSTFHGLWSLAGFCSASVGTFFIAMDLSILQHFCISSMFVLIVLCVSYRYILPEDAGTPDNNDSRPLFAMPDKNLLLLGLIGFCGMLCEGAMFDWSGIYFRKEVHAPSEITTLGYTAFMFTMAGGRFIGDTLATKFGTYSIIQVNGFLIALGLLLAITFPVLIPATIGFLLVGLGVSTIIPLVYGITGKTGTMAPGIALASVSSISFLGFLAGPPMVGFISDITNLRWSFSVVALLGITTILLARAVQKRLS